MHIKIIAGLLAFIFVSSAFSADFERDVISTSGGDLAVTSIGHGTLMFEYGGKIIHVDPWSVLADYASLPRADLVLLTHHHIDHLDSLALFLIRRPDTITIGTPECARKVHGVRIMRYGDTTEAFGIKIEAVPAYNFIRPDKSPVHPRGLCNGYILTFGNTRLYLAGETENIPELALVRNIDIAFIAMDGVFNMTPEAAAEAVKVFHPGVVYPIHYGASDLSLFTKALEGTGIEVRIRKMR
jgi:L-ascorbate metabolism protein UlaG (beta-lactamase superfamily)